MRLTPAADSGFGVEAEGADRSALRAVVDAAEAESMGTCEFCGAPGSVCTHNDEPGGWRKPVCATCHRGWSAYRLLIVHGVVRERQR